MIERLRKAALSLLEPGVPASSLRPEVLEMMAVLASSRGSWSPRTDDIAAGETRTPDGVAISPTMAAMCADDFMRTIAFVRGTHSAIVDARKRTPDRPARVLYAGCGPYATLAMPLMAVLPSTEATFTLLDLHPESIASARAIVDALGLSGSVARYEIADAASHRLDPEQPPDVILVEVMRACLEAEPQVAVTRHLLRQAPHALLVPEEVRIEFTLVDPAREFDPDCIAQNRQAAPRDRIPVGLVFTLSREAAASWAGCPGDQLPGATVRIPESLERRYQAMLFTVIRTRGNHVLRDYDSGLTCPRVPSIQGAIQPGVAVRFRYALGSHPGLCAEVLP